MLKKNSFGQNKRYKKCPLLSFAGSNSSQVYFSFAILLLAEAQSLKLCVGFSILDSVSFLLKFVFLLSRKYGLFNFAKCHKAPFKIKIIEKPHALLLPDLWFLSCNKTF